ncbi:MAG: hypothetical protein ABJF01_20775 [bacterium]
MRPSKRALNNALIGLVTLSAALAGPATARAQRDTTARAVPTAARASIDSFKPPITPRRAFAYSFMAPGTGQSVLGRHKAAVAFLLVEAVSLGMIRESGADVHEARRAAHDSVIVSYVDAAGNPGVVKSAPRFDDAYVHTRAAHVEDWIALLVANHLFSGADAFVSAHLWDVGPRLGLRMLPHGTAVVASLKW